MTKRWKLEALAAMMALVLIFALAGGQAVAAIVRAMPEEKTEEAQPFVAEWATVVQKAPTHDGPGLRYAMNGSLPVGMGVEVVRQENGYSKCLTYLSAEPVWVSNEYLEKAK